MRLRHPDGSTVHLAYCSNVHPADDLDGVAAQLERYAAPVRERLGVQTLGVGLWVAAPALADASAAPRLSARLRRLGLEVVTLNGFPYRAFHAPVVKLGVYRPDWTDPARRDYTLALADLLAALLPDDVAEGSISTLPLGWRDGWSDADQGTAIAALHDVAEGLERIQARTGRRIRLALEPEPGCAVETVAQACDALAGVAPDWIGVCLDACHLAVQFETPADAVARLREAGLAIVKAQVSSALRVARDERELLSGYDEPRFLHQVRERVDGRVAGVDDLPDVAFLPGTGEWRVHFHVPVHRAPHSTQAELVETLGELVGGPAPLTRHLEVETYTWSVLAGDEDLVEGLASELAWTRDRLVALGMEAIG